MASASSSRTSPRLKHFPRPAASRAQCRCFGLISGGVCNRLFRCDVKLSHEMPSTGKEPKARLSCYSKMQEMNEFSSIHRSQQLACPFVRGSALWPPRTKARSAAAQNYAGSAAIVYSFSPEIVPLDNPFVNQLLLIKSASVIQITAALNDLLRLEDLNIAETIMYARKLVSVFYFVRLRFRSRLVRVRVVHIWSKLCR